MLLSLRKGYCATPLYSFLSSHKPNPHYNANPDSGHILLGLRKENFIASLSHFRSFRMVGIPLGANLDDRINIWKRQRWTLHQGSGRESALVQHDCILLQRKTRNFLRAGSTGAKSYQSGNCAQCTQANGSSSCVRGAALFSGAEEPLEQAASCRLSSHRVSVCSSYDNRYPYLF